MNQEKQNPQKTVLIDDAKYEYSREHGVSNKQLPPLASAVGTPAEKFMPQSYVDGVKEERREVNLDQVDELPNKKPSLGKRVAVGAVATGALVGTLAVADRALEQADKEQYKPTEQQQDAVQRGLEGVNPNLPENPSDLNIVIQPENGVKPDNAE